MVQFKNKKYNIRYRTRCMQTYSNIVKSLISEVTEAQYLSVVDFVSQVIPEVSELGQWLLDHVSICLIGHLLQQELTLMAELLHINLLLINLNLVVLLR